MLREIKCNKRKTIVIEVTVKWGVYTELCFASVLISVHLALETVALGTLSAFTTNVSKRPQRRSIVFS